ncbi:TadE/TadG family type IV pilus assembly protein [Ornithinimicrobium cerasi]|uniref:TadE/TadG family type IV pilus assembly protein n=1 Tax=Ornithinimicrobium cerasi TaxID=2248773 RepID=UPI000EFDD4BA|nr:TadE family protein [Ornithinimicrobium cerasi]
MRVEAPGRRPERARHTPRSCRPERGSIALEFAFAAPIVLLLLALTWTYGRVAWANGHLEAGARDAARVATQARSLDEARADALAVLRENTAAVDGCGDSVALRLDGRFEPGETLTVEASCSYSLSDIGLPGAPGTMTPRSSFSSVIDLHRGIEGGAP